MFSAKGQSSTLSPFYGGPAVGIDGGLTVGTADAIGYDGGQFEIYAAPNGTIDGGRITGFIGVRLKGSIGLGTGTKPTDGAVIGIANPGTQAPIMTIETNGNNISIITYDPNGGAPIVRIGGGSPMAQNILIEADDEVKLKTGSLDLRLDAATTGTVRVSGGPLRLASYTVAGLPSASTSGAGSMVYVSNESGGGVVAFSDGTDWRRCTDRAVVS